MMPLQAKLYQYLLDRIDNPVSPSYQEMADFLGLSAKSNIHRIAHALIRDGYATKTDGPRSLRAVPRNQFADVPTGALQAELIRRGALAKTDVMLDERRIAVRILDAFYGPRMGEFYLHDRRKSDVRHRCGLNAARAVIAYLTEGS